MYSKFGLMENKSVEIKLKFKEVAIPTLPNHDIKEF